MKEDLDNVIKEDLNNVIKEDLNNTNRDLESPLRTLIKLIINIEDYGIS